LRHKRSIGPYLAFLSVKYEVDPEEFFSAIVKAGENKKSSCGSISIECRGEINAKKIFLMTNYAGILAQFRVPEELLLERDNPLGKFLETEKILRYLSRKRRTVQGRSIRDVWSGMSHVSLKAKILEVAEPMRVITKYGNYASLAKALIWDETGTIQLCLWNDQIGSVSVGDSVRIENARAYLFRGEKQLSIGTRGLLTNVEGFESQSSFMD
jgi:Single-stranded DNA binding protein Ssb-like, OB fold